MTRIAPNTKIVHHAVLAVEECDTDYDRYKTVHNAECTALRDPENIHVDAGIKTLNDLAELLSGYAICQEGFDTADMKRALKPCALKTIGLA